MKGERTIASFWVIGLFLFGIIAAAERAEAQEQALEVSDVQFNSEGETVFGKLYHLKELKAPAPAIVALPGRGRDFASMDWLYKPLAQKGYVVMPISFRNIRVRYYLKDVEDARNAMTYLESFSFIDKSRFGLYGHSRGGMAALMSVASGVAVP